MPLIRYRTWSPQDKTQQLIDHANRILYAMADQGFTLTLRQLYYQFVSEDLIPNTVQSYNRLGEIISKARDAGLIDWDAIEDRARSVYSFPHYLDGEHFLDQMADRFHLDLWDEQLVRVEVYVEKEALSQVVARAANEWDVPYFPNKGYVSASAAWQCAQRYLHSGCDHYIILHLGDHDPSGIDMSRDLQERLNLYSSPYEEYGQTRPHVEVRRIALNMDQVDTYSPPPNPAKTTDSRYQAYRDAYGDDSWELDALDPQVIVDLIDNEIQGVVDHLGDGAAISRQRERQEAIREQLRELTLPEV